MGVRVCSLSLVILALFAALMPVPVVGQSPSTDTSVIVTDILFGAPAVGSIFATDLRVPITGATVTWAALATGSPVIGIAVVPPGIPPGSVLFDPGGQPIPSSRVSVPTITVIDVVTGTIEGVVQRQGTQTDHAGVEVIGLSGGDEVTATVATAADGSFSLAVPMGGTYTINASYPGYLRSQKGSVSVVNTTMDIGSTTLVAGDVNADNCINILDIVSIIGKFGLTGLPASDFEDINDDGTINILDLTIAAGNFTLCGPTIWAP